MRMRWISNMLPEEKRLYFGAAMVGLITIATFIGVSFM